MKTVWDDLPDKDKRTTLDWIVTTCLLFGSTRYTAYLVAAEFARGLDPIQTSRPRPVYKKTTYHKNEWPLKPLKEKKPDGS